MNRDLLLQEYLDILRNQINITTTEADSYTQARVSLIKEYLEKPSHERYWLIKFEQHWREEQNNDNNR